MICRDYNSEEISNICNVLLSECRNKLKQEEIAFIDLMYNLNLHRPIDQKDRDTLIAMHDRMAEPNY